MRTTQWDTVRARALKNEGRSILEIADMVGATASAVRSYFNRVDADDRRLQQKLEEARGGTDRTVIEAPQRDMTGPQPLTVHDAAELLTRLDQLYPSARLECGATEGQFYGLEFSLHRRDGQDTPDVTVWLK